MSKDKTDLAEIGRYALMGARFGMDLDAIEKRFLDVLERHKLAHRRLAYSDESVAADLKWALSDYLAEASDSQVVAGSRKPATSEKDEK